MNSSVENQILRQEQRASLVRRVHVVITILAVILGGVSSSFGWFNRIARLEEEQRYYDRMESPRFARELDYRVRQSLLREQYVTSSQLTILASQLEELKKSLVEMRHEVQEVRSSVDRLQGTMDARRGNN